MYNARKKYPHESKNFSIEEKLFNEDENGVIKVSMFYAAPITDLWLMKGLKVRPFN